MSFLFRRLASFCSILLLIACLTQPAWSQEYGSTSEPERTPPALRFENFGERDGLVEAVRNTTLAARHRLLRNGGMDWPGTITIYWADEREFRNHTGHHPENSAAAASAQMQTVWINAVAWSRATEESRQETMAHELAHILIGNLPGGTNLPLWANEGLAMQLAGQWSFESHMKLLEARFAGRMPQLSQIEERFPDGGEGRTLAYQMSQAAIGVVAHAYGDETGEVRRLLLRMADPQKGPRLQEDFWDPFLRDGWQRAVEISLGSRFVTGVIVLASGGFFAIALTVLLVIAFFRLRQKKSAFNERELDDEAWADSLTEDDVQDIYGDRDDRWRDDDDEREQSWR